MSSGFKTFMWTIAAVVVAVVLVIPSVEWAKSKVKKGFDPSI
jgi:hypothetical protein